MSSNYKVVILFEECIIGLFTFFIKFEYWMLLHLQKQYGIRNVKLTTWTLGIIWLILMF